MLLKLLAHLLLVCKVKGHVTLTFPQSRFPPLDFLDTARTFSPCGVPKPMFPRYTELYVDESYNFTWRMQYPHQGGYRISVINEDGDLIEQLAPTQGSEYLGNEDQTIQYATVRPTRLCTHCTILLERQALEWGKAYGFRSCADVTIVQRIPNAEERCSKHGYFENGKCLCRHSYSGDLCQYKDHCSTDEDCANDGKCVKESHAVVRRTCYCAFGYFGQNCNRAFDEKPKDDKCFNYNYPENEESYGNYGLFDGLCFKKTELNMDDFIYSRVIRDELEVIMDYKSRSWISVGWRPMEIDRSCRLFPDLENARRKRSAATNPELLESTVNINASLDQRPHFVPEINLNLMPVPMPKLPKNNGLLKAALLAPLHPMDCTDIVIGSVRDGRSRINDMYTRDRSTPLLDTWLDGEESFSAAYGIERDGRTIIMFRRRIAEIEPSDHPLGPGKIFVIYAKGQTSGDYSHAVKSALEEGQFMDHDFYKDDQVKYHGNKNRGVHSIEFVSADEQLPNIRPPPRFRPRNSSIAHQPSGVLKEPTTQEALPIPPILVGKPLSKPVSSSTTSGTKTSSSTTSSIGSKPIAPKTQIVGRIGHTTISKSKLEPEPKKNIHEMDYWYFDNGSSSGMFARSRLSYVTTIFKIVATFIIIVML